MSLRRVVAHERERGGMRSKIPWAGLTFKSLLAVHLIHRASHRGLTCLYQLCTHIQRQPENPY